MAEALARELSYDGALIRLCESLEVRATPQWFDCPQRERARLEHELLRRGILLPPSSSRTPAFVARAVAPLRAPFGAASGGGPACLGHPSGGPGRHPATPR